MSSNRSPEVVISRAVLAVCIVLTLTSPLLSGEFNVFGPETFAAKTKSAPVSRSFTSSYPKMGYFLRLIPKGADGAAIYLNNTLLVNSGNARSPIKPAEWIVELLKNNTLKVEVLGKPGTVVTIQVVRVDWTGESTVFGPEQFVRPKGMSKPVTRSFSVQNPDVGFFLEVSKIKGDGGASVSLNGVVLASVPSTNRMAFLIKRPVNLGSKNTLVVQVMGKAGTSVSVRVFGFEDEVPSIEIVEPANGSDLSEARPLIRVTYSDKVSGIDPNTFTAEINGVDSTALFKVTATEATCQPETDLPGGENTITAKVKDHAGNSATATSTFRIASVRAIPGAHPTSGYAPLTVRFTTNGEDPAGTIQIFRWDFDGNGTWDTYDTVANDYTHTYSQAGTYKATLYVKSSTGAEATASVTIQVNNNPPIAKADAVPSNGAVPLTVQFTGSGTDPDGTIALYEWDFQGDGTYDWSSTTTGNTSLTYTTQGTYRAVFRVTDNLGLTGTALAITTVVAVGPPGSPTAKASANPTSGDAPLAVNFSGTGTDPDGTIVLYEWDFNGDGTYDWSSPTDATTTHTYTQAGTNIAALRVKDNDGKTGVDYVVIVVNLKTSLSVSPNTVGFLGADPNAVGTHINTTISADTAVSIYIKDSLGNKIRTLVNNKARTMGSYSDYWNCRDDAGFVVNDGLYYAILAYKLEGAWQELDQIYTTGGTRYSFPMGSGCNTRDTFHQSFSPFDDDLQELTFRLCTAQEVTSFIGPLWSGSDETRIRTIVNRRPFPAGQNIIYWDGLDDQGNVAQPPPGDQLITGFWRYDLPTNAICMTGGTPQITGVAAVDNYFSPFSEKCDQQGIDEGITLVFTLSENVQYVELRVYNVASSSCLRKIRVNALEAGQHSIYWDGKNNNGEYVDLGDYRLGVIAKDAEGNESMLRYTLVRINY